MEICLQLAFSELANLRQSSKGSQLRQKTSVEVWKSDTAYLIYSSCPLSLETLHRYKRTEDTPRQGGD